MYFFLIFSIFTECNYSKHSGLEINKDNCFPDRAVTKSIEDITVTCIRVGDSIIFSQNNTRYAACNADDMKIKEGAKYQISGKCYEIKPNERWPGTPFEITALKSLE